MEKNGVRNGDQASRDRIHERLLPAIPEFQNLGFSGQETDPGGGAPPASRAGPRSNVGRSAGMRIQGYPRQRRVDARQIRRRERPPPHLGLPLADGEVAALAGSLIRFLDLSNYFSHKSSRNESH